MSEDKPESVTVLDYVDNIEVPGDVFRKPSNEYWALVCLRQGLEFLYLMPGSIGGALAGNARFDDTSIGDVLISLVAVHPKKSIKRFSSSDLGLSYKLTGAMEDVRDCARRSKPCKIRRVITAYDQLRRVGRSPGKSPRQGLGYYVAAEMAKDFRRSDELVLVGKGDLPRIKAA